MSRRSIIILSHIAGWLLFFTSIIAFISSGQMAENVYSVIFPGYFLLFVSIYTGVFYLNELILLPGLLLKKRYLLYATVVLALFLIVFYLKPFELLLHAASPNLGLSPPQGLNGPSPDGFFNPRQSVPRQPPGDGMRFDLVSIILFVMMWAASTIIVVTQQWRITEQQKSRAEIERANARLDFLKAQISPHFLFNTLNNIYALAIKKSEKTPPGILRLSNIMRYVTDEGREDFVPVEKEISCVNDYIELQKLRLGGNVEFNYEVTGIYEGMKIAPLIIIPFIENTFKHGVSKKEPAQILVKINVDESGLRLETRNRIFRQANFDERVGVGLQNVKQRLQHLYKDKYSLKTQEADGIFIVNLKLDRK